MNNPIPISDDCCAVWQEMIASFGWFQLKGSDVLLMPYLQASKHRVNYCPSCGKERRETVITVKRFRELA